MRCLKLLDKNVVHKLSERISSWINRELKIEGIELVKLQYGLEVYLTDLVKMVPILILMILHQIFFEAMITLMAFNCIRSKAHGVHASTSAKCLIMSISFFVYGVIIVKYISLSCTELMIIAALIGSVLFKYAPSDSENNPLIGAAKRKKLKKETMIRMIALTAVIAVCPIYTIQIFSLYGIAIAAFIASPLSYKLLKRRMNNYEQYEN